MGSYYEEIKKELGQAGDEARKTFQGISGLCQEYYYSYSINKKLNECKIKSVLQGYMKKEDVLAERKQKEQGKRSKSLNVDAKLYIEFFWNRYCGYHGKSSEKEFFDKMVYNEDYDINIDDEWYKIFGECGDYNIKEKVIGSIEQWAEFDNATSIKSLELSNLHNAMKKLNECLELPKPSVEQSLEAMVAPDMLELWLSVAKEKVPFCIYTAPVTRALYDGVTKSFTPRKGNKTVYFREKFEYNLLELKHYIEALKDLSESYNETRRELSGFVGTAC